MKIGVYLGARMSTGGGFQYELRIAKFLSIKASEEYNFVFFSNDYEVYKKFKELGIKIIHIKENSLQKIYRLSLRNLIIFRIMKKLKIANNKINKFLTFHNIDLVYFLSPFELAKDILSFSYITTCWDMLHREQPEFPELNFNKAYERREALYSEILPKAVAVIVDSKFLGSQISRYYHVDKHRIYVLPFLPTLSTKENYALIDIKKKYDIEEHYHYIFYPAQFWSHKNHIYILNALKILKDEYNIKIYAIFSGSNFGNLDYIESKANEFNIQDQIKYIGFVENSEIPSLYKNALALVMPTYCGPTNLPPLEAFSFECPVFYSDLPYFKEQVGDAVFYIDLKNPRSLSLQLIQIIQNRNLINEKIQKGKELLKKWTDDDFWNRLKIIIDNYKFKQKSWKL